jgi:uncharacterized protein YukE
MIGGDINGLTGLADRLKGVPPQMEDVVNALDRRVGNLVHDAGWWGDAADMFKERWDFDARGARALAEVVKRVAEIVGTLAGVLRDLESALEGAVVQARAAGVPVGTDGQPLPLPPGTPPTIQTAALAYAQVWQAATEQANLGRMEANVQLQALDSVIGPPRNVGSHTLRRDQWTSLASTLVDFWAVPAGAKRWLGDQKVPALQAERDEAHRKFSRAQKQFARRHEKTPDDLKEARRETLSRLQGAEGELDRAEGLLRRFPFLKLLDAKTGDVFPALKDGSATARFVGDIPILDGIAVVLGTALSSYDDMQKGDDWRAVPKEAAVNVGAIAAGTATMVVIVGAAAAPEVSVPAVVVVGGAVVAGGLVAVGVGSLGQSVIAEHWDEDIHDYGVAGGVAHGTGNVAVNTAKGVGGFFQGVGGAAVGIWHGVIG